MEKARCFFCNKELSELEERLLDRPYLKVCLDCRNMLHFFKALQSIRGNGKEVSRDGYYANR